METVLHSANINLSSAFKLEGLTAEELTELQRLVDKVNRRNSALNNVLELPKPKIKSEPEWIYGENTFNGTKVIIHEVKTRGDKVAVSLRKGKALRAISPEGVVHIFPNLTSFVRMMKFDHPYWTKMADGLIDKVDGWSLTYTKFTNIEPYQKEYESKKAA